MAASMSTLLFIFFYRNAKNMMTIEEIREALRRRKLPIIAEETGISYQTIWRISTGESASYATVKKLSDYLTRKAA